LYSLIQDEISYSLFGGKSVNLKLYKLAVYEKDGHFDWHRDTTHGDDHHATVLVALNTEWKGGNLGLRHQGTTVDVDLHPTIAEEEVVEDEDEEDEDEDDKDDDKDGGRQGKESKSGGSADKPSSSKLNFQIIAFYTDIEHKVEKITDGTRIVLQFDVNVKGGQDDDSEEDFDDEDDGDLGGYESIDTLKPLFPVSGTNDTILKELVVMIKEMHASNSVDEVVFPLRHLYRMASIKPEYLKGVDGYLYEGLKTTFDVSLKPIMLIRQTDEEGSWSSDNIFGIPFVSKHEIESERPQKKRKVGLKSEIHVPAQYELRTISSQGHIEHTGNEAQSAEDRYFGGGMFVAEKI
jgi:2OG-Fe(II) oxygenase superfamily